jgi:class 3 adenylate cyclase
VSTRPETRYAPAGEQYIAFQTWGSGPPDLIVCGGAWTIEALWDHPGVAHTLERLGRFARNVWFDARGLGVSSRPGTGGLDMLVDDIETVLEAIGSKRTIILAFSEGAAGAAVYAASHPARVSGVVIVNGLVRFARAPDYPLGVSGDQIESYLAAIEENWGQLSQAPLLAPSMADDPEWCRWWLRAQRLAYSPDDAAKRWRDVVATDAHHVLQAIQAPTLVLHRRGDRHARVEHGRYIADQVPGAICRELEGDDHFLFAGDVDALVDEIEEFVTGARPPSDTNRVLVTVVFTDIVNSSQRGAEMGDRRWRALLDAHDAVVRSQLERYNGREVNTTGDGFLATFDRPARAIHCATEIAAAVRPLGIDIRASAHTGEVELRGEDIAGVAVNTAARVLDLAESGEVLVSRTVTDLVAGSGINFRDRGEHTLRGIPGRWPLFAVDHD